MRARPNSPCYPPRANSSVPFSQDALMPFVENEWISQCKFNDSHCLIKINSSEAQLYNRHNAKFTDYKPTPELQVELNSLVDLFELNKDAYHVLDGGILDKKHSAIKQTIVVWDILAVDNKYLVDSAYKDRLNKIEAKSCDLWCFPNSGIPVARKLTENIIVPICWNSASWQQLWDLTNNINGNYQQPLAEGLMLKNPNGLLEPCFSDNNNGSWMCRCRIATRRHNF